MAEKREVKVMNNGPLRVSGPITVCHPDGRKEQHDRDVFLCRCGHSDNKPFCDGTHKRRGFTG